MFPAADRDEPYARERPQEAAERDQRQDGREQREREPERAPDEVADVLGDALVGVVDPTPVQLNLTVRVLSDPTTDVIAREPAPPADLEPLAHVDAQRRDHDQEQ